MKDRIDWHRGIVYEGNLGRMKAFIERCKRGEQVVIGFLGGSITQGSLSSSPKLCYAYRTYQWFVRMFPQAEFVYVNAGIGGTTSHFGAGRVESDLLTYHPDFVIAEFSVNDENTEHFKETYEGLVRRIYQSASEPAMLLVHNIFYDTGKSAQEIHEQIGRYYDIPCVSIKPTVYEEVLNGSIERSEITPDNLHPNDFGHELLAEQIITFLQMVLTSGDIPQKLDALLPPLTKNRYEITNRYHNQNCEPLLQGFVADGSSQKDITDCFKNGWSAKMVGNAITFQVSARTIAVQYRRSVNKPAPIAEVTVDGVTVAKLDANFDEDWGDKLELETVFEAEEAKPHTVDIRIVEAAEDLAVSFYLTALLVS